jgi:flagellar basal-body rod protein FlgC
MDYFRSFQISAAGLSVEMLRMETAALNLANANTSAPPGTEPFRALDVLAEQVGVGPVRPSHEFYRSALDATVEPRISAPRMVYEPAHPHADENGFVTYANVDVLSEMVSMMRATRAYEANVKAINAAKAMAQSALEIGSSK